MGHVTGAGVDNIKLEMHNPRFSAPCERCDTVPWFHALSNVDAFAVLFLFIHRQHWVHRDHVSKIIYAHAKVGQI
jgi:hypothetical protein